MKTKIILFTLLFISSFSFAQNHEEKREKIKALKVAFLTEKLELTPEEAQKFWPIYNLFDEKQYEIRHKKISAIVNQIENSGIEKISEKEASNLVNQIISSDDEMYVSKKKFMLDLQKVLPAKKIILLKKYEDEFNRKLLRQFKGRRE
jgi:Spy/CpxP family protein refolding chaperone